jgi:hypothetical protein
MAESREFFLLLGSSCPIFSRSPYYKSNHIYDLHRIETPIPECKSLRPVTGVHREIES